MNRLVGAHQPELRSFVDSVAAFCAGRDDIALTSRREQEFSAALWSGLASLGVLGLGTTETGGAAWLVGAMEALGSALCPGPLPSTLMALHLLDEQTATAVAAGTTLASVGLDGIYPWGLAASVLISLDDEHAWLIDPQAPRRPMRTLAREPWARVRAPHLARLGPTGTACSIGDLAVAAYLVGSASGLLARGADHARVREQFGRPIGSFQAVAFPLASCAAGLHTAGALIVAAASTVDADGDHRAMCAAARLVSTDVALRTVRAVHQVHGGSGFAEESPVAAYAARIRQWSLLAPSESSRRDALLTHQNQHAPAVPGPARATGGGQP